MKKSIFFVLSCIGLCLLTTTLAYGENTSAVAAGGGISMNNPNISLLREELTISLTKIKVSYLFKNNSKDDITTQLSFTTPPYTTPDDSSTDTTQAIPFSDFSVSAQGNPIQYDTKTSDSADNKKQSTFSWTQPFPAQQVVLIEHQYTLDPGNNTTLDYLLIPGANSKKPIGNFILTIEKPADTTVTYNHFYGKQKVTMKDVNQGVRIFLQKFIPKQNLQVVFNTPDTSLSSQTSEGSSS
jgi:hypothetical protein